MPVPCLPVYCPSPGDEDHIKHSQAKGKWFYVVGNGCKNAIYTDCEIARDQIHKFSDSAWKRARTWDGAVALWNDYCPRFHAHACPPIILPTRYPAATSGGPTGSATTSAQSTSMPSTSVSRASVSLLPASPVAATPVISSAPARVRKVKISYVASPIRTAPHEPLPPYTATDATLLPDIIQIQQDHNTVNMWDEVFPKYWARFPWCLHLAQDPNPNDPKDYAAEPANEVEEVEKAEIKVTTEKKIKLWFNRQRPANELTANPWTSWLTQLHKPNAPPPRKLPDFQFYMQHEDQKQKVMDAFQLKYRQPPPSEVLKLCAEVARKLWEVESDKVKKKIREEAAADALQPLQDPKNQELAQERFTAIVGPLLEGLKAHTGYEVSLFTGRVVLEDGKMPDVRLVSVHVGVTSETPPELDFAKSQYYPVVAADFSRFIDLYHTNRVVQPTAEPADSGSQTAQANSTPYVHGFSGPILPELQLLLQGMSDMERDTKLEHLKSLDAGALARENNAARNH
ncbi:hypothetical protein B0H19DRAFT_1248751 [Mycena capillaripes]|nr:hypothetical protein B0H19DRAFT_1248751 [Mycena capillaripes]